MTENPTTADQTEEQTETGSEERPEKSTYTIRATRVFEMDFTTPQLEAMVEQTDADGFGQAVERAFLDREVEFIEPEQKLIGADVDAEYE